MLGAPGGGSAAVASLLRALGAGGRVAAPGEPVSPDAPEGDALLRIDDALLRIAQRQWDAIVLPGYESIAPHAAPLAVEAKALLARRVADSALFALADPRLARLVPFWQPLFRELRVAETYVVVLRHPLAVAASLARRFGFSVEKSTLLWLSHLRAALVGSAGRPQLLIDYDRLVDEREAEIARLVAKLELDAPGDASVALASVDPSQRRAQFDDAALYDDPRVPDPVKDLHRALRMAARDLIALGPIVERLAQPKAAAGDALWLGRALPSVEGELVAARERIAHLEAEIDAAQRAHAARDKTEATLRGRIEELSQPIDLEGRPASLDEVLASLRADVARIGYTLGEQPAREQELRLELVQAQRDLADERAAISRMVDEIERTRAALFDGQAELEAARGQVEALLVEIDGLRGALAAEESREAALADALEAARADAGTAGLERDTLKLERDAAQRELATARRELETLRRDAARLSVERDALARETKSIGEALATLREELPRRAASESTLAAERDRWATDARSAGERLAAIERELGKRSAEFTALTGRHEQASRTLARLERDWIGRIALARTARERSGGR